MEARFFRHDLQFIRPGGTSRGILHTKETYILEILDNGKKGVGECAVFRGLSADDVPEYPQKIEWLCQNINENPVFLAKELKAFPSIWFGYEQAMLNLKYGNDLYFPSEFTEGKASININGLIWMGTAEFMQQQIEEKLSLGFRCLKLKIGTDWLTEREILMNLREIFPKKTLELRVDANGGFNAENVMDVLHELSDLEIHSIEQPIKAGNYVEMARICKNSPVPIALDEELIGVHQCKEKAELLEYICPQFIILKPSLVGGFSGADEWISLAEKQGIGWWITSALESNIGLNAIAQYTFTKTPKIPQGLGTGALFSNNFPTHLILEGDELFCKKNSLQNW